jgi:hypothetical protein
MKKNELNFPWATGSCLTVMHRKLSGVVITNDNANMRMTLNVSETNDTWGVTLGCVGAIRTPTGLSCSIVSIEA